MMMDVLKTELAYFNKIKTKFVQEFSQEDFDYIEQVSEVSRRRWW